MDLSHPPSDASPKSLNWEMFLHPAPINDYRLELFVIWLNFSMPLEMDLQPKKMQLSDTMLYPVLI
jgi:hypothetical protein